MANTAQHLPQDIAATPEGKQDLEQAYALFSRMSEQLRESQGLLEQQVAQLKAELAEVSAKRTRELAEKARLAGRLQNLLDLLPGGVIVLDGRGVVRETNPVARELLGEPLEGQLWRELIRDRFAPRDDDYHEVSLRSGRRVSIATRSLRGEPGQIILLTDLTETRQLQAQLARNERLSALGRMVASLAHQIRTPLSTALLYASHLNQPELSGTHRQRFSQRLKDRLQTIELQVRDMLMFAKGDLPLNNQVTAQSLFAELQQQAETLISESGADCRWDDRAPAGVRLLCNQETLIGAALNLIENAIQAGAPTPRLKVIQRLQEGRLSISVVDGGRGMSREELARIGEPFYTTRDQGTGLGVSVVKSVAQAHGGAFMLRSRAGQGSWAELVLPVLPQMVKGGTMA
ncbi:MAG: PAS domain-containing protein [Gammaproteobacteria bacterium]|nr:PAS domain-containing protein [Gammaproteobacteria bacterium]